MNTFFTSDTHFGHANIIKYVNRPFASVQDMDEAMIANWNRVVDQDDLVYHLGDFAMGVPDKSKFAANIRRRLNGRIRLIMGNHDPRWWVGATDTEMGLGLVPNFESIDKFDEVVVNSQKIVLCHYGLRTWHHDLRGVWHAYGHSHSGLPPLGKSCDVGVDCWNFTPVSFEELRDKMNKLSLGTHPGFPGYKPSRFLQVHSVAKEIPGPGAGFLPAPGLALGVMVPSSLQ